ncbi:MAG: hypothetical protein JW947_03780 [Sedimentisphaerales bacterium]|nr:hypothetical protein [Sedimentisphaerales bacterium]
MENKQVKNGSKTASKTFLSVGPTLRYSHANVQRCWLLAVAAFGASASFWSKVLTGSFWSFDIQAVISPKLWNLGQIVISGVSIFEYPWQILVLGLLMGIMAVVPVLVSQLMSFRYSLPFIFLVFFAGNLPAFAVCLLISCVAAACRPLRFRSRFVAIVLCTAPQLAFWAYFGSTKEVDPIKWGFSFTPWICAWLIGLGIAGLVIGIGHFTRYRPGVVWVITVVFLFLAVLTFEIRIGFDELDYQLYVAKNNPEQAVEFHDHPMKELLDKIITQPSARVKMYLEMSFYPREPILLRAKLKEKLSEELESNRWPWWFEIPPELNYQAKRRWLSAQYDTFISRRPASRRMPMALYYRALLSEYSPDIEMFVQKEVLHFYSDYPYERSQDSWEWLYTEFGDSAESLEARWRLARYLAGRGNFELADKLLAEAQDMTAERLKLFGKEKTQGDTFFSLFRPPADSAITVLKLTELQTKLNQLRSLIGTENRIDEPKAEKRLARFVMLNPRVSADYARGLNELLEQMGGNDPLRDNVLLAQVKLVADEQLRAEKLSQLHEKYRDSDGGMQALYELARLKIGLYQGESNPEHKKKYLSEARTLLTCFISLYPDSFNSEQAKKNLDSLPKD